MEVPEFARGSPLLEGAFLMAQGAHHGPRREADTNIEHPVRVAELLSAEGFDDTIVAAALLHEVIEDTATDLGEVEESSGPEVARLVAAMTENEEIQPLRGAQGGAPRQGGEGSQRRGDLRGGTSSPAPRRCSSMTRHPLPSRG